MTGLLLSFQFSFLRFPFGAVSSFLLHKLSLKCLVNDGEPDFEVVLMVIRENIVWLKVNDLTVKSDMFSIVQW